MEQIVLATKAILINKIYLFVFLILVPLVFILFVFLPIWTIPGNNLEFQLKIFTANHYILMIILSTLVSLFVIIQAFIFRNAVNARSKLASVGSGGAGGYVGVFAAVLGTATCASCLAALFGFLGIGSIIFLLNNQLYVISIAIALLFVSLYFSARKVNGVCKSCRIKKKRLK